ncbi:tartrate dehydrogenase, putative [Entamoeba histolytica KU27]|uniref:Tartrate dehydrogenase, putative n=1 Tax=Entamoeba histolytica KU27 TaxID=885311 RepID=M2R2M4_ENTHI|nr:tartrate dehydrogenase, putative [Entamoeba histolytica KU27]
MACEKDVTYQHKIIVIPGDGIGAEVMNEAEKMFQSLNLPIQRDYVDWGIQHYLKTGKVVPIDYIDQVKQYDAILLGSLGDPRTLPDYVTLEPLIQMRQQLDQFLCLRPAKHFPGIPTPLKKCEIDVLVVRENSEGEYSNIGGIFKSGTPEEFAIESAVHSRRGLERVIRYAFEASRKRRNHVTLATKSNAMKFGMVLWDSVFEAIAMEYPDVTAEKYYMDALSAEIVKNPSKFDVIVGSNLFCDIISDLTVTVAGSMGIAPSANINPERTFPSLFEPVHGSALDIAGKVICDPIGTMRASSMMLEFLGYSEESVLIEEAIQSSILQKITTIDIGGTKTTIEVGDFIANYIRSKKSSTSSSMTRSSKQRKQ